MELGRPSNTGSLISAVLVGLLALGANQYARLDPRKLDDFFAGMKSPPEPVKTAALVPPQPTLKSVSNGINFSERELFPLFGKVKAHVLTAHDANLRDVLKRLSTTLDELERDPQIRTQLAPATQLALLRALFMAAELHAEPFADAFSLWSERLLDSPNRQLASQAAALIFFRANDLDHPQPQAIVHSLREFSAEHTDPELGIHFYLNVAEQLRSKGHAELARVVIKLGIELYKERGGTHRLVNWLIDHNPPGAQK